MVEWELPWLGCLRSKGMVHAPFAPESDNVQSYFGKLTACHNGRSSASSVAFILMLTRLGFHPQTQKLEPLWLLQHN